MKSQAKVDESEFPDGFKPVEALAAYLRSHEAVRTVLGFLLILIVYALWRTPSSTSHDDEERAFRETIDFDDEPLDDEDLAALAESDKTGYVSLGEYFDRRTKRAAS